MRLTEKDYEVLYYLWKWKALSTMALGAKYFPEWKPFSVYRRLMRLADAGLVESVSFEHAGMSAWLLATKGYKKIRYSLPDMTQDGFRSENTYHDFFCTALQLGRWLVDLPAGCETTSEQQLRRLPVDLWADWVPRSAQHRPDGYSRVIGTNSSSIVAFEVELNLKSADRYDALCAYYGSQATVSQVLWLVDSRGQVRSIEKAFERFQMRDRGKHQFVLVSDFKEMGWQAPIVSGNLTGKSPASFLCHKRTTNAPQSHHVRGDLLLLNAIKRPSESATSPQAPKTPSTDRL